MKRTLDVGKNIRHDGGLTRQVDARTFCVSAISQRRFMRLDARTRAHVSHCRQSPPHHSRLLICRLQLQRRQSSLAELIEFSPRGSSWAKPEFAGRILYRPAPCAPRQKARVLPPNRDNARGCCLAISRQLGTTRGSYRRAVRDVFPWPTRVSRPRNGRNSRNRASTRVSGKVVVYE